AMRYTEARLTAIAGEMLADIDKATVDFVDNYDGTQKEPTVLPAKLPNLLVNGSSGIAVGMATNIPPHHLGEIVDATIALIDAPELTSDELCQYVTGPDFPTGGTIFRYERQRNTISGEWETVDAIRQMYAHGRGRVVMRAQVAFNMNMLALVDGQPQTLPLKSVLQHYIDHRREIVRRRTEFDLEKARERAHILEGLKIALDHLDAVIKMIRESPDVDRARTN